MIMLKSLFEQFHSFVDPSDVMLIIGSTFDVVESCGERDG